jgi:transcriptional regulator with XRE-family HTH domain
MSTDSERFAARLHQVFDLDEVEAQDRVPRLAKVAQVSKSTARRWLAGQCLPTDPYRLLRLAKALVVTPDWLVMGRAPSPEAWRALRALEALQLVKGTRAKSAVYLAALGDPGAIRAIQRYGAGEIGRDQFLAAL